MLKIKSENYQMIIRDLQIIQSQNHLNILTFISLNFKTSKNYFFISIVGDFTDLFKWL